MTSGPDLILGVARAADAAKHREAVARLERLSRQASGDVASTPSAESVSDWATELRRAAANANSANAPAAGAAANTGATASAGTTRAASVPNPESTKEGADKKSDVYVQFEAVLLQNMIESMMPQDYESMFGTGTAGSIWKSMLAEKIAVEIARSGTIGIAKQVSAGPAATSAVTPTTKAKVGDA